LHLPQERRLERRGARLLLRAKAPVHALTVHRLDDVRLIAPTAWHVSGGRQAASKAGGIVLANIPTGARLEVRLRNPGDRFHPAWRDRAVKVKDFLRDQHVPLWERDRVPLVVLDGRVVAIYPRFAAQGFAIPARNARSNARDLLTLQLDVGDAPI